MDSVEIRIQRLLHGGRDERETALFALRELRFELARLAPVLQHPHVSRQVKAIEILRHHRRREAVALLVPMLASPHRLVAWKAASALGHIGGVAPDLVAAALETATSAEHRLAVLDALSRLRHPAGREALVVVAGDREPSPRRMALYYMRRYREAAPADAIRAALFDPEVRDVAIEVAGRLRHPDFFAPLLAIWLEDPDPPLRAKRAVAKYGVAAIEPLVARAAGADPRLRERIADALEWCLFATEAARRIWELWTRPEPAVRDACLRHLGSGLARDLPGARRRAALAEHVGDPEVQRRRWCLMAYQQLARLRDADGDAAVAALSLLARDDPDPHVRDHAAVALRGLALGL